MKTPVGWERMDAAWWPMVAAELRRPWPREAVWFDLRWWAGQVAQKRCARPGRPALQERWGWSDWDTRAALKSGLWEDPFKPDTSSAQPEEASSVLQPASSPPPAVLQPASSQATEERRESQENIQRPSSDSPASLQQSSPRAYSRITDHVSIEQQDAAASTAAATPRSRKSKEPKPEKPPKPPEDPRLRQVTDLWVRVLREEGVIGEGEPSGLRMSPGDAGVDRRARDPLLQVAGIPKVNGADRWEVLEQGMRTFVKLTRSGDKRLFPRDGALAFDRLPKAWPTIMAAMREDRKMQEVLDGEYPF